jgi:hypothetical protein
MAAEKKTTDEISEARRKAGWQGGQAVKATFGTAITRRRFAELIDVAPSTIRRWETAGLVEPRTEYILNSPTKVFDADDVEFGRLLIAVLRKRSGEVSLREAAEIAADQRRR